METAEILRILREEIHSAVFATVDEQGFPATRVIDIMLTDEDSLYFITAKGKAFYRQLTDRKYAAVSGMTQGKGSLERKAVSVRGKVENVGSGRLAQVFEANPYMAEIYPEEESRTALEVFRMYEGEGEYFDLSAKPVVRHTFSLGGAQERHPVSGDYYIDETCSGCGECLKKCPQMCIDMSAVPYVILQEHCLRCGNCQEVCPCKAVHRR